ncbi:transmembrane protein 42-like [Trichogramma pretiosum]|uniref:transmembrane protein 42-like n=1 Tax=Trichogramma pretiosum TaxID=7493 RepID=UPI0006C93F0A|nr:transmembrane protein 42-like [Trichogramma pretiosum]
MTSRSNNNNIRLAVLSGGFATAGGVLGKYGMDITVEDTWSLLAKCLLLAAMISSNTLGCTMYVKSLAASASSLPCTITSSSVNYFCSAILGMLLFGETTSLYWWSGTSLVLLGLLLICNAPPTTTTSEANCNNRVDDDDDSTRANAPRRGKQD